MQSRTLVGSMFQLYSLYAGAILREQLLNGWNKKRRGEFRKTRPAYAQCDRRNAFLSYRAKPQATPRRRRGDHGGVSSSVRASP
jgi:hypothetical protein